MPQRSYKAVFFDLDGTLLPIDMDAFLKQYFADISAFAQERGYDPQRFVHALGAGVRNMVDSEGGRNCERYWSTFMELMGEGGLDDYQRFMDDYYDVHFGRLGALVPGPNPDAARAVAALREKGYTLFLTTMPLFPRAAVEKRLEWAGVPASSFARITTYDNSTSTKPHLAYYRENLEAVGLPAEQVLMVGNNTREDLAAMKLGCDGYLVTDWLLDPDGFDIDSVKHGSLAEFAQFAEELPECE